MFENFQFTHKRKINITGSVVSEITTSHLFKYIIKDEADLLVQKPYIFSIIMRIMNFIT